MKTAKNVYISKDIATSIPYRLIHDNLPKFIDNIQRFQKAKELGVDFQKVEEEHSVKLADVFSLSYFNNCLTQKGIDAYNAIRGGVSTAQENKQQGINEIINLFAQTLDSKKAQAGDGEKQELQKQIKAIRSCKLEELYKQILSDRTKISFRQKGFTSDAELCKQINSFVSCINVDVIDKIKKATGDNLQHAKPEHVYINNNAVRKVSTHIFGDWKFITDALQSFYQNEVLQNKKSSVYLTKKDEKEIEKLLKQPYFSFAEIHNALEHWAHKNTGDDELQEKIQTAQDKPLYDYFQSFTVRKHKNDIHKDVPLSAICTHREDEREWVSIDIFKHRTETYTLCRPVLEQYANTDEEKLKSSKEDVQTIKAYLDALQDLFRFLKPLYVKLSQKDEKKSEAYEKDSAFYSGFEETYHIIQDIVPLYNQAPKLSYEKAF